ncbi:MAG: manganese efflux pump MntP family protein [Actinomycetota bacterium]|nr:manganese efflux pump MntP family protein [Actinomycetota bacterium]
MNPVSVLLIAFGVSADAFAVALGKGLHMRRFRLGTAFVIAATFGAFQAAMPIAGWALGKGFEKYVAGIDHWVAFGLLVAIGGRMVWEAYSDQDRMADYDRLDVPELLLLAVATSIDALAVGISLAFLSVSILAAAAVIGITTFALSFVGILIGHRAGIRYRKPAEIAGGVILILIGVRVLLVHLGYW